MLDRAAGGIVGVDDTPLLAIPFSGGGSGGAFRVEVFRSVAGQLRLLQTIDTDFSVNNVKFRNGRLIINVAHYLDSDPHCCASGHTALTYSFRNNQLTEVARETALNVPDENQVGSVAARSQAIVGRLVQLPQAGQALRPSRVSGVAGNVQRHHVDYVPDSSQCDQDSISSKSDDSDVLIMLSGATYKVSDVDISTSSIWLAADDVLVCEEDGLYKIIDKDDDGSSVEAKRVDG